MTDHDKRLEELLADQALWGLDEAEQFELQARLAEDQTTSEEWGDAAALAAFGLVDQRRTQPPERLRERIEVDAVAFALRQRRLSVEDVASAIEETRRETHPEREARPARTPAARWFSHGFAAAAFLLALGILWWRTLDRPPSAASVRSAMLGETGRVLLPIEPGPSKLSGSPAGDVVWSDARQRGYLRLRGLPVNDRTKRQYQLWIFDRERSDKKPVDGGVFDIASATSEVLVPIDAKLRVFDAFAFAITVERPGGVAVSDRDHIVATAGL